MTAFDRSADLRTTIAEVLYEMAEDAERLGAGLCVDPQITANHGVELQGIDLFAQTLRQLSVVLAAESPCNSASNVTLEELRSRLVTAAQAGEPANLIPTRF